MGVIVSSTVDAPHCTESIFTFEVPLAVLPALAAKPWIVSLAGSSEPMDVQDTD